MGYQGMLSVDLLKDQTVDETTSKPVDCRGRTHVTVYLSGAGTTSSGVISIEESMPAGTPGGQVPAQSYSGTWSLISAVNASTVTGGAMAAQHLTISSYGWIRVRITTVIGGGGSISAGLVAV